MPTESIYLYLDEAGDFNFKPNGTRHFLMTCVIMQRPFRAAADLLHMRYDLIERGELAGCFHASEDRPFVRDLMFRVIRSHISEISAYSLVIDKRHYRYDPNPKEVYQQTFQWLIAHVAQSERFSKADRVIAITDDIPNAAKKGSIKGELKKALKENLPGGLTYTLIHQRSEGDFNLQIADYLCWAQFRLHEKRDKAPYMLLASAWSDMGIL
ncbi:DUF3800 domain-containing protein [Raoultibacter phocaeensis]|uniref:DUF3800 domain-containing protein n=1 Tax=Raoultibacter phocaeensis TaxID=2479841 RepID=UPI00111BAEAA|nr:DUF3800 domain-containing protein [Raoultibacter phocaeensis]